MSAAGVGWTDEQHARLDPILARLDRINAAGFVRFRLDELADDVGRLHRHLAFLIEGFEGTYTAHLVERIARHLEALDARDRPTAGELVEAGVPVDEALAVVDREAAALRRRLGGRPR